MIQQSWIDNNFFIKKKKVTLIVSYFFNTLKIVIYFIC